MLDSLTAENKFFPAELVTMHVTGLSKKENYMNKTILAIFLAMAISCPVFAASSTDINNQKTDIQTKYDNEKNTENQSYNANVADAKQSYQNDSEKLNSVLKELEIKHNKTMDDLNSNEKMDFQKVSEENKT